MKSKAGYMYEHKEGAFTAFAHDENMDTFYCITDDDGLLIKLDGKGNAEYVCAYQGREHLVDFMAYSSVFYDNKCFFFSFDGKSFIVYDIKNNSIRKKMLCSNTHLLDDGLAVMGSVLFNDVIYVFMRHNGNIIKINARDEEVVDIVSMGSQKDMTCFCCSEQKGYCLFDNSNIVAVYDFSNQSINKYDIGITLNGVDSAFVENNIYYLLYESGEVIVIDSFSTLARYRVEGSFSKIIKAGDIIWLFPKYGDEICFIRNGIQYVFDKYDDKYCYYATKKWFSIGYKFYSCISNKRYYIFPVRKSNMMIFIDKYSGELSMMSVLLKPHPSKIKVLLDMGAIIYENNRECSLESFMRQALA